jgi:hypothetical protein
MNSNWLVRSFLEKDLENFGFSLLSFVRIIPLISIMIILIPKKKTLVEDLLWKEKYLTFGKNKVSNFFLLKYLSFQIMN